MIATVNYHSIFFPDLSTATIPHPSSDRLAARPKVSGDMRHNLFLHLHVLHVLHDYLFSSPLLHLSTATLLQRSINHRFARQSRSDDVSELVEATSLLSSPLPAQPSKVAAHDLPSTSSCRQALGSPPSLVADKT